MPKYCRRNSTSRFILLSEFTILGGVLVFISLVGCAGPQTSRTYEVTIPEEWKSHVSVGKLRVVGSPFYGVIKPRRSMGPLVRINWSVRNLTSENLDIKVNYWSKMTVGKWKSGFGVPYKLGSNEERTIDNIYPVISAKKSVKFGIRMVKLQTARGAEFFARHNGVMTGVLPVLAMATDNFVIKEEESPHFVLKSRKLMYSQERGNIFSVEVTNRTDQERPLVVYAAAGDPNRFDIGVTGQMMGDRGPVAKSITKTAGNKTVRVEVPYVVPDAGPKPLLVFTLFEPSQEWLADEGDMIKHCIEPFCWGWYDLCAAAERGQAKLADYVPAEERAKLTAQRESEHFLFRYRPASYAEQNLETIIGQREEAYDRLSRLLQMELPETVMIDLYPDMEAKGQGSGTTWTPCNTRSNKHIAEVYSKTYQCDAYHELAHIFSYHFPNFSSNAGGLVEAFAVYFEPENMNVDEAKENLKRKPNGGKLKPLSEILLSDGSNEELVVLIDFLIKKDVEKFKEFYVRVTRAKDRNDLEKASQKIYETDLRDLEEQWQKYLN